MARKPRQINVPLPAEPGPRTPEPGPGTPATIPATATPLVALLAYQREDVESPARFNWSNWSRQIGKSFTKSLRRIIRGMLRRRDQVFLSAGERQSRELMEKAATHLRAMKIAAELRDDGFFDGTQFRRLEISIPGSIRVIGLPANPLTARGYTADVLLDEFAMHRDDREIYAAVFGSVIRNEGELDVCSTPKGRKNTFYELSRNEAFRRTTVTIHDAVAAGLDVDVAAIRAGMPYEELFRQEFLCEFLDEATAFLTHEQISACEDVALGKAVDLDALREMEGGELYAGVDIGRRRDLTVIWLWQRLGDVLYCRGVIELSRTPFAQQMEQIRSVLRLPRMRRCCVDATGLGMPLAEALAAEFGAARVEAVTFTPAVKDALASGLRALVEDRRVRIPVDAEVHNDWHSITMIPGAGGRPRYEGERRLSLDGRELWSHADRFWAAALGADAARTSGGWNGTVRGIGPSWRAGGRGQRGEQAAADDDADGPAGGMRHRAMRAALVEC